MNKHTTQLMEQNRGLQKRLKAVTKASENNYRGMMHWKQKATRLAGGLAVIDSWIKLNAKE